ncbi:uncharacterized protein [Eucyclogobius newberryi]|uniref:uncharacterized protein n=1 Tax=Eucyclogobius newberryi TaxID=166745 RepID=UPI003B5A1638
MSSDKNPEVVGCDASIMMSVWEIRTRELCQKTEMEEERMSKSALPGINQDWAARLAARQGGYKRVERKAKVAEPAGEDSSMARSKRPAVPRVAAPAPNRKATPQRPLPAQAKGKKGQEKRVGRVHQLMTLTNTQPSPMVWGKSWKFSKDLPLQEESTDPPSWGQCWIFSTQQPFTEAGGPWPNGPCKINPRMLRLWDKPFFRVPEEEPLSWTLCNDEWDESWKNANKANKESTSEQGSSKNGFFTSLVESHRRNNDLYSSEWSDCWKSTKPSNNEGTAVSIKEAVAQKTEKDVRPSTKWAECWRLSNHHGLTKTPEVCQNHSPEWSNSWSVAMVVQNNPNTEESAKNCTSAQEFVFADRNKPQFLFSDLDKEFKAFSEWSKSWQVNKNDTKPSPEIEKTLKTEPPKTKQPVKVQERPNSSTSDEASKFLQLKHSVLFRPRKKVTHSMLLRLRSLVKASNCPEWKDSWKMVKHQLRASQRERRVQLKPFEEKREKEWKDSWKCTNPSLGQNPEMWQQGWTTTDQIRVNRAREHNHFAPVELPKNGPTSERTWNESWRMFRHQQESSQRGSTPNSCSLSTFGQPQRQLLRSAGDWQEAWRVSETQHRHDKPSYAQWVDAWRNSGLQSGNYRCNQRLMGARWMTQSLEIQFMKEMISVQRAEKITFQEKCPDKVWVDSWKVGPVLQKCSSEPQSNMGDLGEYGSKWGMSFRLANPMPKIDQPWVETSPNMCSYNVIWPKHKKNQKHINTDFTNNSRVSSLWAGSPHFFSTKLVNKAKPTGQPIDPRVILTKKTKLRKQLYVDLERNDKKPDKKWAGSQLLCKTQPKPKRGEAVKKVKLQEDSGGEELEEAWAESWRFLVRLEGLKNKVKSLRGWEEAWKMLMPMYQTLNGPRAK